MAGEREGMTLNDVALLYAALGVSWGSIVTFRCVRELATGEPDPTFAQGASVEERKAMLGEMRDNLGGASPLAAILLTSLALVVAFVVSAVVWPIDIARTFRKGKA